MNLRETRAFWRLRLPHWEVENGIYFITIRCQGSLPSSVKAQLVELRESIKTIEPDSKQFETLQKQIFSTCEKFLDQGHGFTPFLDANICEAFIIDTIDWCEEAKWGIPHFCVMPNHIHAIAYPKSEFSPSLKEFLKRLKGRTARRLNAILDRTGSFWQTDWFDRWVRNEHELQRTIEYIRNNPVKAGIVNQADDYPYSK